MTVDSPARDLVIEDVVYQHHATGPLLARLYRPREAAPRSAPAARRPISFSPIGEKNS